MGWLSWSKKDHMPATVFKGLPPAFRYYWHLRRDRLFATLTRDAAAVVHTVLGRIFPRNNLV